jgi:hypothetical protein
VDHHSPFPAAEDRRKGNLPTLQCPNAATMMDDLFAFVCSPCGESVEVQPSKIQ